MRIQKISKNIFRKSSTNKDDHPEPPWVPARWNQIPRLWWPGGNPAYIFYDHRY